jgi:hypothetical protein
MNKDTDSWSPRPPQVPYQTTTPPSSRLAIVSVLACLVILLATLGHRYSTGQMAISKPSVSVSELAVVDTKQHRDGHLRHPQSER